MCLTSLFMYCSNKLRAYCTVTVSVDPGVSMGVRWVHRSRVMGDREAVNSSGGPQRAGTASLLFMKLQPRPGSRLPGATGGGVVTVPTGIGSWSQGQRSRVWCKGCGCLWVWRGSDRQVGCCCRPATPAPPVNQCAVCGYSVCVCVCVHSFKGF